MKLTAKKLADSLEGPLVKLKNGDVIQLKVRQLQNNEVFDRLVFLEIPE